MATDFDVSGENLLWYGRLQLLFRCTLCPARAFQATQRHIEVSLAFFSTFEPVEFTRGSIMQRQGVPMFYDSASCTAIPSLYICHVKNILGRVPMMPCFVEGNTQPTIPYRFRTQRGRAGWAADTSPDAGNGSRLYELNLWMWRYGRGQERKVTVLQAMEAQARTVREARARAGETVKRRRVAAGDGAAARAARDGAAL